MTHLETMSRCLQVNGAATTRPDNAHGPLLTVANGTEWRASKSFTPNPGKMLASNSTTSPVNTGSSRQKRGLITITAKQPLSHLQHITNAAVTYYTATRVIGRVDMMTATNTDNGCATRRPFISCHRRCGRQETRSYRRNPSCLARPTYVMRCHRTFRPGYFHPRWLM